MSPIFFFIRVYAVLSKQLFIFVFYENSTTNSGQF